MTDLVAIPGGTSVIGSDGHYPEERPASQVAVAPFRLARRPVTVAEFRAFVEATGHVTVAERRPDPAAYPGVDPALLVPGSSVFTPPSGPVDLRDPRNWWSWVPGACWRRPEGPGSDVDGRADHPVVHVAVADALAYCRWARLRLPTEPEWEHACRGGLDGAPFAWGDQEAPDGVVPANVWRGAFPWRHDGATAGTTPVGRYPPNGFGLVDVIGNAWELTSSTWSPRHGPTTCCVPAVPDVKAMAVAKGGSFLCSPDYCARYRPAARIPVAADSPSANVGFRCAVD